MAFFDPVDPSTESLLWPGRVGFCIVAGAALSARLLPSAPSGTDNWPECRACRQDRRAAQPGRAIDPFIARSRELAARPCGRAWPELRARLGSLSVNLVRGTSVGQANCLRIAPPLTIPEPEIDLAITTPQL